MKIAFGPEDGWGRKGVAGERGAGRNSEGRILNGELPSMGDIHDTLRVVWRVYRVLLTICVCPDRTYPPRIAKIFCGSSFSLVPDAGAF